MSDAPEIRWSTPADRDAILAFIAASGFTPRDAITWDGLSMRAVCAWRGKRLVGVLPVEPRPFIVATGVTVFAAHLTCVAVCPAERGSGIGSAMQRLLADSPPTGTRLLTVYREEPDSAGYRWYLKNGFVPATHVRSWTMDVLAGEAVAEPVADRSIASAHAASLAIRSGGRVDQRERPLDAWLDVHPYRRRYTFEIVSLGERGYAVIGVGTLHSDEARLDVMDLVADEVDAREVLEACVHAARRRGIRSLRIALAAHGPFARVAAELGMTAGWSFDLLVRSLDARLAIDSKDWRYASIDFA